MRRITLLLVVIASLVGRVDPSSAQQWMEHRPADAGFRIEFPERPEVRDTLVPIRSGGQVRAFLASVTRTAEGTFLVAYTEYPAGALSTDKDATLDNARDGGLERAKGRLREERRLSIGNAPARRIVFDVPEKREVGVALIVLSGQWLYQAIVVTNSGSEDSPDVRRFLSSFALVPR